MPRESVHRLDKDTLGRHANLTWWVEESSAGMKLCWGGFGVDFGLRKII